MTTTLTQRIFAAIPDAHTVWPEWFSPVCNEGHYLEASIAQERNNAPVLICLDCRKDVLLPCYTFDPPSDGDSPHVIWNADLEDKRNLWAVWEVACHVSPNGYASLFEWRGAGARIGTGVTHESRTPQHALLAAIAAALGIKR